MFLWRSQHFYLRDNRKHFYRATSTPHQLKTPKTNYFSFKNVPSMLRERPFNNVPRCGFILSDDDCQFPLLRFSISFLSCALWLWVETIVINYQVCGFTLTHYLLRTEFHCWSRCNFADRLRSACIVTSTKVYLRHSTATCGWLVQSTSEWLRNTPLVHNFTDS